ncbi:MAG: peptidase, partial [Lachnospiraceae bacterium]|nr:peptidase [Lachnospiraceae bacterium]
MQEFFVQRVAPLAELQEMYGFDCILPLDEQYAVGYANSGLVGNMTLGFPAVYGSVPKCYAIMEEAGEGGEAVSSAPVLEAMGIARLNRLPYLDLSGRGVMIGFIDTGIDYTHPVFIRSDGTSRIAAIWDQTAEGGNSPQGFAFGAEYTEEELTQALKSDAPFEIVPERDENGHG